MDTKREEDRFLAGDDSDRFLAGADYKPLDNLADVGKPPPPDGGPAKPSPPPPGNQPAGNQLFPPPPPPPGQKDGLPSPAKGADQGGTADPYALPEQEGTELESIKVNTNVQQPNEAGKTEGAGAGDFLPESEGLTDLKSIDPDQSAKKASNPKVSKPNAQPEVKIKEDSGKPEIEYKLRTKKRDKIILAILILLAVILMAGLFAAIMFTKLPFIKK